MPTYKTPGVYIVEVPSFPPSIAAVETAIPAFIGYTEKAREKADEDLLFVPKRITSMLEYIQYFGGPQTEQRIALNIDEVQDTDGNRISIELNAALADADRSKHLMYYSLQAFYANGGGPCYIVSVGGYSEIPEDAGNPIPAIQPGDNTPTLMYRGLAEVKKVDEVTLICFPESQGVSTQADQIGLFDAAMAQCFELKDRFTVMDLYAHQGRDVDAIADEFRANPAGDSDTRSYGGVYFPDLNTTFDYAFDPTTVIINHQLVIGDADPVAGGLNEENLTALSDDFADLRVPAETAIKQLPCRIPASPVVLGAYARVDNARGVFKAPANVKLNNVIDPVLKINDELQAGLNVTPSGLSINAIRTFVGRGNVIYGARTLDGNSNDFRYVPVRRFLIFAEESIKKAMEQFVFEPNDANTWATVRGSIENFLTQQWNAGALAGAKPEQAFFVRVALGETMTAQDILEGRMIVAIGLAIVRPAEFIILEFSQIQQQS